MEMWSDWLLHHCTTVTDSLTNRQNPKCTAMRCVTCEWKRHHFFPISGIILFFSFFLFASLFSSFSSGADAKRSLFLQVPCLYCCNLTAAALAGISPPSARGDQHWFLATKRLRGSRGHLSSHRLSGRTTNDRNGGGGDGSHAPFYCIIFCSILSIV